MSALDAFLSPQVRHDLECLIEAKVEEALRLRRPERRFVSVREAAQQMGCSEAALRGRIKRGRVPIRRQGRTVLVDLYELDRKLAEDE